MKTSLFIMNAVSAIFLANILITQPSITGFAVAPASNIDLASPLGFAVMFIIVTISLDIYFYLRSRKSAYYYV